jgi:hypothetical protein
LDGAWGSSGGRIDLATSPSTCRVEGDVARSLGAGSLV